MKPHRAHPNWVGRLHGRPAGRAYHAEVDIEYELTRGHEPLRVTLEEHANRFMAGAQALARLRSKVIAENPGLEPWEVNLVVHQCLGWNVYAPASARAILGQLRSGVA